MEKRRANHFEIPIGSQDPEIRQHPREKNPYTPAMAGTLAILIIAVILQLFEGFVDNLKKVLNDVTSVLQLVKKGKKSDELTQLRQEIKDLLKEASSLSTPSTFAQAAKLKRLAAAKEKELIKGEEECNMEQKCSYHLYTRALLGLKVLLYAGLCLWFWGTPVARIPQHLLQPFGKILSWRGGDSATGQVMVGIIPWLVLTSRVSKYFYQKLLKRLSEK